MLSAWDKIMDDLLRKYIRAVLTERGEPLKMTYKSQEDLLQSAIDKSGLEGEVTRVWCGSKKNREPHCRIFLTNPKEKDEQELIDIARKIYAKAYEVPTDNVSVGNIGQQHSGMYDTYQVIDQPDAKPIVNVVFTGGLTSGQRGGGYAYEGKLKQILAAAGAAAEETSADTTKSDIFLKTASGNEIGIEAKAGGAKFGEPTLQYNFETSTFMVPPASKSPENAQLVADLLNGIKSDKLDAWLMSLKTSWENLHPGETMKVLGTQIQPKDWEEMKSSGVTQSGPMISIPVGKLVDYYKKKKAHYVQISGKGLYVIEDELDLINDDSNPLMFSDAAAGLCNIKPQIMLSGGNKVIRATMTVDLRRMKNSGMDLNDPTDAQKFAEALKNH